MKIEGVENIKERHWGMSECSECSKEIRAGNATTLALLIGEPLMPGLPPSTDYAFWGRNFQQQVHCLRDLGVKVMLNWRPSDPVQGEVAHDAVADAGSYDVKALLACKAALKEGKTPRSGESSVILRVVSGWRQRWQPSLPDAPPCSSRGSKAWMKPQRLPEREPSMQRARLE